MSVVGNQQSRVEQPNSSKAFAFFQGASEYERTYWMGGWGEKSCEKLRRLWQ